MATRPASFFAARIPLSVSNFFRSLVAFLLQLGYFAPLVMGIMDSSFLVLPFGNDVLVVVLVSRHHQGLALYVLAAACGSTIGAALLAWIAGRIGEKGIQKLAGEKRAKKLEARIQNGSGLAVFLAALAPPPFPYTMVIASAAALQCSKTRLLVFNFIGRTIRFTILGVLALVFGRTVIRVTQTPAFRWSMIVFTAICLLGSGLSIWRWVAHTRGSKASFART